MNEIQRENLAKYSYDISKLALGGFVVANIMSDKISVQLAVAGIIVAIIFICIGYVLNNKQ